MPKRMPKQSKPFQHSRTQARMWTPGPSRRVSPATGPANEETAIVPGRMPPAMNRKPTQAIDPKMSHPIVGTGPRFLSLQVLRAVAAIAVTVFHLSFVEKKYLPGDPLLGEIATHADAGVDLFFVLSGFVMTTLTRRTTSDATSAMRFLAARAWRVLPMYWLFTTLVVVLMAAAPNVVNSSYGNQSILASYLLIPHTQLPVLAVGWTLVHEAYFYLVFAFALAVVRRQGLTLYLLGWAAVVAIASGLEGPDFSPVRALITSPLTIEFIVGALLGLHWRRLPRRAGIVLSGIGLIVVLAAALTLPGSPSPSPNAWLRVACFGLPCAMIVAGVVLLEESQRFRAPRWLVSLGDCSYSLYLSHVFVISLVGRAWGSFSPTTGALNHALFAMSAIVASCVVGRLLHRHVESPLMALPGRWGLGGRTASPEHPSGTIMGKQQ